MSRWFVKSRVRGTIAALAGASALAVVTAACSGTASGQAAAAGGSAASAVSASAAARHIKQTPTHKAVADPGFSYFNGRYYLYGTGENFPVVSSKTWSGAYGGGHTTLAPGKAPKDLGTCGQFGNAEWAPQVFRTKNGTLYVMYYSSCAKTKDKKTRSCLGVATSSSPSGGFTPVAGPICAPPAAGSGAEAIDPSPYQVSGRRYMLFKTSIGNKSGWKIWAVRMNATGTHRAKGARARVILPATAIAEAPFAVNHGGKVWLFVARHWFNSCQYSTDVYEASSITGPFNRKVTNLLGRANTGLCGPGGASVVQGANGNWYIAYAAYKYNDPRTRAKKHEKDPRMAYVARLTWPGGTPKVS